MVAALRRGKPRPAWGRSDSPDGQGEGIPAGGRRRYHAHQTRSGSWRHPDMIANTVFFRSASEILLPWFARPGAKLFAEYIRVDGYAPLNFISGGGVMDEKGSSCPTGPTATTLPAPMCS